MKHIVIIGNGISGVTAARYIRKRSDYAITLISAESKYFFSRTALMYVYMGHTRLEDIQPYEAGFWEKNRITLIQAYVQEIHIQDKKLNLSNGKSVIYDDLVLATGSTFNKYHWPGQDLAGVGGLYSLQDLEYMETYSRDTKTAVVVGGGLIGIEMVEMLVSRGIHVTFLVREASYWDSVLPPEESKMISRHILEHHVDLRLSTEMKEILPGPDGRVRAVRTGGGEEIPCQWVGLTAGVHPNIGFMKDSGIESDRGILVNEYFETNVPNVYAIGDCAQFREALPGRRPIEQIWYTGKMHGETLAMSLTGSRTAYKPGIFFNSAKFFDIEYQIYGEVPAVRVSGIESLYWEHPGGKKAIRINFDIRTKAVTGFHLMGIRYRHKVCEHWIENHTHIEDVLRDLAAANFDPEFFTRYEDQILKVYEVLTGVKIRRRSKGSLWNLIFSKQRTEVATDIHQKRTSN